MEITLKLNEDSTTPYGYIYKITNTLNNKIYVGKREKQVFDESYWGSGRHITASINKYGKEHFIREVIEWCDSREYLCERERYWINKLNTKDPQIGYNITDGGLGAKLCGENNGMYGKHHTEESKNKMSNSHPRSYSKEFGEKISKSLKEHLVSKETSQKISQALKGKRTWNSGLKNPYTEATIQKMSNSAKQRGFPKEQHDKAIQTIVSHKYHWYSNDTLKESKKFKEGEQPSGWYIGRKYYERRV